MAPVRRTLGQRLAHCALSFGWLVATVVALPWTAHGKPVSELSRALIFARQDASIVTTPAGKRVLLKGAAPVEDTGAPRLPSVRLTLALPQGQRIATVTVQPTGWTDLADVDALERSTPLIASDGGTVEVHPFAEENRGSAPAQELGAYPPLLARVGGTAILHGYRLGAVEVFPVRVQSTGRVQLMTGCTLRIALEPDDADEVAVRLVAWPGRAEEEAAQVAALVDNPEQLAAYAPPPAVAPALLRDKAALPGTGGEARVEQALLPALANLSMTGVDYLIVTNAALAPQFQRLADDKTARGTPAAVATLEWIRQNFRQGGDDQETIRYFLRNAYQNWGTRTVLLGGDSNILPARYVRSTFYPQGGYTDIPCDLYFAALDGNWNKDADGLFGEAYQTFLEPGDDADVLAELMIGRAPVDNLAEATLFVDKTFEFQNPPDPSYMGRMLYTSEVLFPQDWDQVTPPILDGAIYSEDIIFNKVLAPGNTVESFRLYENYTGYFGAEREFKAAVMDSLRSGRFGGVHHIGHGFYYNMSVGDLNIVAADADNLTNAPNFFWLYALNCSSGAFDFDCLLERFMQNPNGGSAMSIGSCRAAFPTTADRYQQGFYTEVFVTGHTRVAEAILNSRGAYASAANSVETSDRWTHFTYTLLGDPDLRLWRNVPVTPSVSIPASVALGSTSINVGVSKGGQPVNGARVTLRKGTEDYESVLTPAGGSVAVPFRALTTGTINYEVIGPDVRPVVGTLQVTSATAAVVRASVESLNDDAVAPSVGDGDGIADSGETVEWSFRFTNNGNGATATNVNAVLRPMSAPGVTVLDSTIVVGSVAGGASVAPADRFVLQLAPTVKDGAILKFRLVANSGATHWDQDVSLVAYAPEVELVRLIVDDATFGNGDGIIQAGETIRLVAQLRNFGGGIANSIAGTLSSTSPNVTLVDATNSWGALGLKQLSAGAGSFAVAESNVSVENAIVLTLVDERGHQWQHALELRLPLTPNPIVLDPALGPTSIGVRCSSPFQLHLYGYRVYRSLNGGGPFTEVTVDPLLGSGFLRDDGLQQLTKYYYYATAIDSSRIESGGTAVMSVSTAPPEMAGGFPKELAIEVAGHAAVGDILGNGSLCAVVGSNDVYAFKSDGSEVRDGDGDSQTLGPISSLGDKYTPSGITLADLDGNGALEIIASSWNTRETYVFKGDGSVFPGWPKQMNNKNWATPAVGDLDHNGDLEIVINNVGSYTYVWNSDGTEFLNGDNDPGTVGIFASRPGETFNRSSPALFDLDGDQKLEVIFGTNFDNGSNNRIDALKSNGQQAAGWPRLTGPGGKFVCSPTVADLNGDGTKEIVVVCENDSLYVLEPNGHNFAGFPKLFPTQAWEIDSMTPSPAVGDFDHNGKLEIVVVGIETGHECKIYMMDYQGVVRPGWPRTLPGSSESSPVVADINGDTQLDIVFGIGGGSDNDPSQVYAFNANGTDIPGFPITMGGAPRSAATICDFNGDGMVDIVQAGFDRRLHVWSMPYAFNPYRAPWPTFRGNSYRTGVYGDRLGLGVDRDQPQPTATTPPKRVALRQNVPNPFNPFTTISFDVPAAASGSVTVRLDVLDVAGRRVRTLLAESLAPGAHAVRWDGLDDHGGTVSSGVYVARLSAAGEVLTLKMTLAK